MALWSVVYINDSPLFGITVQRIGPSAPADGELCSYQWTWEDRGTGERLSGAVDYPYGDALALMIWVLQAVEETRRAARSPGVGPAGA